MRDLDAKRVNKREQSSVYKRWCADDVLYLKTYFQHKDNGKLAEALGTSKVRVAKKISSLGLKRDYKIEFPDIEGEEWRVFKEESNYLVSNKGRFRNATNNSLLKPWYSKSDYYYIDLGRRTYLAHRVVALTWVENPEPEVKTEVNHLKGIKDDFRPCQLEWVTPSENQKHAFKIGLKKTYSGVENPNAKLSINDVAEIRTSGFSSRKLAEVFGVDKSTILNVRSNKTY